MEFCAPPSLLELFITKAGISVYCGTCFWAIVFNIQGSIWPSFWMLNPIMLFIKEHKISLGMLANVLHSNIIHKIRETNHLFQLQIMDMFLCAVWCITLMNNECISKVMNWLWNDLPKLGMQWLLPYIHSVCPTHVAYKIFKSDQTISL